MSAVASLQKEIEELTSRLQAVSCERDELVRKMSNDSPPHRYPHRGGPGSSQGTPEDPDSAIEVQRYEERIVELHSVIAELTRKLDDQNDDVIKEEDSEYESNLDETQSFISDSCPDEPEHENDEHEDYTSLAFERDMDAHTQSLRKTR